MPANSKAIRLNLEFYRKQAKALLRSAQSGDETALARLSKHSTRFDPAAPKLHDAQFAIAREEGFPSWPRFRAFLVQSGLEDRGLTAAFIDAALSDLRRATEILAQHPSIKDGGFYVDLVLGNATAVEQVVAADPGMVRPPSGPQNLTPLIYTCFSRFARPASGYAGGLVETARRLLRHGADPNATWVPTDHPDYPLSCVYAASGLNNNPELTRLLLEAGANPNDNESLYHATEHADLVCLKLLLQYGAKPERTNALKHILDREDLEGLRLLLRSGADPNEINGRAETALHWAVLRGRSPAIVAELLEHGSRIDAQRSDNRTAYAIAIHTGQRETAALLASRGACTELMAIDRFLAECATLPNQPLESLLAKWPDLATQPGTERLIPDLTSSHQTALVRTLLAAGVPVNARGEMGATALHWACWKGYADLVAVLLQHGASLTALDGHFHGTPPGWFGHGVRNCGEGGGDYPAVARLLIAAGATIPAVDLPTGHPEVDTVLREAGLI